MLGALDGDAGGALEHWSTGSTRRSAAALLRVRLVNLELVPRDEALFLAVLRCPPHGEGAGNALVPSADKLVAWDDLRRVANRWGLRSRNCKMLEVMGCMAR